MPRGPKGGERPAEVIGNAAERVPRSRPARSGTGRRTTARTRPRWRRRGGPRARGFPAADLDMEHVAAAIAARLPSLVAQILRSDTVGIGYPTRLRTAGTRDAAAAAGPCVGACRVSPSGSD